MVANVVVDNLRRVPGSLWSLLALGLGVALGTFYPEHLLFIAHGVNGAIGWIAAAMPYIIFFTLTPAIASMLDRGSAGKFAGAVMVAMVVSTLSAGLFGILVAIPILNLPLGVPEAGVGAILSQIAGETFSVAVSAPPFIAIWISIATAFLLHFGARADLTRSVVQPVERAVHWVGVDGVELLGGAIKTLLPAILLSIGIYIPTSAAGAVEDARRELSNAVAYQVWGSTNPVVWYLFTVLLVGLAGILWLLLVGWLICRYTGFPYKRFVMEYFAYLYPFSWATASSAASIPINLELTDEALEARSEVRDFIIPLGATVNLDGTMMAAFMLLPIAAYLVGYQMTVMQLFMVLIPLTIVSVGVPGIPGGLAIVAPPVVLAFLPGLPETAFIAIFAAFGVGLTDQFRTGVNTVDNGLMCLLFEHWWPDHFAGDEAADAPAPAPAAPAPGTGGGSPRPEVVVAPLLEDRDPLEDQDA